MLGILNLRVQDAVIHHIEVITEKWGLCQSVWKTISTYQTCHHFIQQTTKTPPVNHLVVSFLMEHLRRKVLRCSTEGMCLVITKNSLFGKSKVGQSGETIGIKQNVLRFYSIRNRTQEHLLKSL